LRVEPWYTTELFQLSISIARHNTRVRALANSHLSHLSHPPVATSSRRDVISLLVRHIARARHATLSRGLVAIVYEDAEVVLLGVVREPSRGRSALRAIGARGSDSRVRDRAALDAGSDHVGVSDDGRQDSGRVYSET